MSDNPFAPPGGPVEGYRPTRPGYGPPPGAAGPQPRRRRGWVVAAIVVGAAVVLTGVGFLGHWSRTVPLGSTDVTMDAWPGALGPGHCVETMPEDGAVTTVRVVPCDQPHQGEVLSHRRLTGEAFPGKAAVTETATASCEMDRTQAELGFRPVVWTPSEEAWRPGGTAALCLAALPSGTATGSFAVGDEVTLD